ncbi:hypothetical protein LTR10_017398 [Elasticomyces elasticus]|uniref:Heterokaryon incompatibility domain-containing protein n=1 Tax=Exophiala sideris TaxID=1016849 RepID=A0ABR0J913_9EURO|nr:hypothetical protein LTR10_017398 [Elasticomyces elasticus]KAK5037565.1 hypothetical protein LTR13_004723 [Exophiala sideris]KAK5059226.1 hypothetical protein LTR69_006516 [Exophiala sideris]KAK5183060.1 hypothetical protein LTR44_004771 [Eurotiomycetes sp. CCFEE 6388]
MDSRFVYEPLRGEADPEIRLVNILPGSFEDPIQINLFHAEIKHYVPPDNSSPPPSQSGSKNVPTAGAGALSSLQMEALSYAWGNEKLDVDISVNGQLFKVTPTLELTLRYLRRTDTPRTVWIDAISLDQSNQTEKYQQIPVMHLIFAQACRVIVDLGPPSDESRAAMQFIRDIHATIHPEQEQNVSDAVDLIDWPTSLLPTGALSRDEIETLVAWYKLLKRAWWYRAWIVQEISFARDILFQCGSDIVSYTQLQVVLHVVRKVHPAFAEYTDIIARVRDENVGFETDWPAQAINNALNLDWGRKMILGKSAQLQQKDNVSPAGDVSLALWLNKARLCTLPHDRVFAAFGMAGGGFRTHFNSRYDHSIQEHNRNVVRAYVAAANSLDIILHSQHSVWLPEHSSWAPDWGQNERAAVFHLNKQKLKSQIPLAPGMVSFGRTSGLLRVYGKRMGAITSTRLEDGCLVEPLIDSTTSVANTHDQRAGVAIPMKRRWWIFKPEYELGQFFDEALERLPSADPLWSMHLELFLTVIRPLLHYPGATYLTMELLQPELVTGAGRAGVKDRFSGFEQFWELLEYLLMCRTVSKMDTGQLLVASDVAQVGDVVAILAGCSNPVVLRPDTHPTTGGPLTFRLLGDAHGLGMDVDEISSDGLVEFILT